MALKASEVKVGDTITTMANPCDTFIDGFEDVKPMVFAGKKDELLFILQLMPKVNESVLKIG